MRRDARAGGVRDGGRGRRRALLLALPALLLLLLALLGGVPRLLVTNGTSMLPTFSAGDLAVLRPSRGYDVGDVAAYRSAVLPGTVVLHRVLRVLPDGRLVLQGDHNPWVDPEQPGPDAMLGELLVRVPGGGRWLQRLSDPRLLAVGAFLLVATGGAASTRRRARGGGRVRPAAPGGASPGWPRGWPATSAGRSSPPSSASHLAPVPLPPAQRVGVDLLHGLREPRAPLPAVPLPALRALLVRLRGLPPVRALAVLVVVVLVAVLAGTLLLPGSSTGGAGGGAGESPVVATATAADPEQGRRLTFGYAADVRPSRVYDRPRAQAPLPVFRRLGNRVEVHVDYRGAPGTMRVDAVLSMANGWRAVAPMTDPEPFEGSRHDEVVWLDLDALERRMQDVVQEVGLPADTLRVEIVPTVEADGTSWSPVLAFELDTWQLRLADGPESLVQHDDGTRGTARQPGGTVAVPLGSGGPGAGAAQAAPAGGGLLGGAPGGVPGGIPGVPVVAAPDGPLGLSSGAVRVLVLVLLSGGVGVAVVLGLGRFSSPATATGPAVPGGVLGGVLGAVLSPAAREQRRYGSLLLPVAPLPLTADQPVVEVADLPALARLAERYGLLVLHWQQDGVEVFVVQDERTTYRVQRRPGGVPAAAAAVTAPAVLAPRAVAQHRDEEPPPALPTPPSGGADPVVLGAAPRGRGRRGGRSRRRS